MGDSTNPTGPQIIRNPENYEEMIKKLQEREQEDLAKAQEKLGENPQEQLQKVTKELQKLRDRREFKALTATEKEKKIEPADPHVLEVRNTVTELSKRIDTAIMNDPKAKRALKGRVTMGKPEGSIPSGA